MASPCSTPLAASSDPSDVSNMCEYMNSASLMMLGVIVNLYGVVRVDFLDLGQACGHRWPKSRYSAILHRKCNAKVIHENRDAAVHPCRAGSVTDLPKLSRPAGSALAHVGINSLKDLTRLTE